MPWPDVVLTGVACLALLEALYSLWRGYSFWRFFRACPPPQGSFTPPLTLIVPCRGVDPGLEQNLRSLLAQDYPNYQVLLVTGEEGDSCRQVWARLQPSSYPAPVRTLVAGPTRSRSQKIHNLLHALRHVRLEDQVIVFADSDIRVQGSWLGALVEPLREAGAGLATGFRWYLPPEGGFASKLRAVWNAGIASLLGEGDAPFAWGGAMAIRKETFAGLAAEKAWAGALSDDFSLSNLVRSRKMAIRFQPRAMGFSLEECTLKELLDWSFRQLAITRVYRPDLWVLALAAQLLNSTALWVGLPWALWRLLWSTSLTPVALVLLVTGAAVYLLGCAKAWLRWSAIRFLFPEHGHLLERDRRAHLTWGPLASLVSLVALARSAFRREIEWRGIRYRLLGPHATMVLTKR